MIVQSLALPRTRRSSVLVRAFARSLGRPLPRDFTRERLGEHYRFHGPPYRVAMCPTTGHMGVNVWNRDSLPEKELDRCCPDLPVRYDRARVQEVCGLGMVVEYRWIVARIRPDCGKNKIMVTNA